MAWTKLILVSIAIAAIGVFVTREPYLNQIRQVIRKLETQFEQYLDKSQTTESQTSAETSSTDHLFTKEEIKPYNGKINKQIYIAVVGSVFDVTKGERFYAEGNHYGGFSGKDGTRAFVTGKFDSEGLVEDISDFSPGQMLDIYDWEQFYRKSYIYIGKLIGRYYDANGNPTDHLKTYEAGVREAQKLKQVEADDRQKFPPCNSEWKQDTGSRVWCTTKSGGVNRDWVGVPRKYHKVGASKTRCACIRTSGPPSDDPDGDPNFGDLKNPTLEEYKGCSPLSESCKVIKN